MTETHVLSSKSDVAYAELRRQILSGDLAPGSRLAQYELAGVPQHEHHPAAGGDPQAQQRAPGRPRHPPQCARRPHRRRRGPATLRGAADSWTHRRSSSPAERRTADDIAAMEAALQRLLPVTRQGGEKALAAHRAASSRHLWRLAQRRPDPAPRRPVGQVRPLPPLRPGDRARRRVADPRFRRTPAPGRACRFGGDGAKAALLMHLHITSSVTPAAIAVLDEREQVTGKSD